MLVFLLSGVHNKQWTMIVVLLLVCNSVTAVDEYCIEKPWECCDGDSSVKPGKVFLTFSLINNHRHIITYYMPMTTTKDFDPISI